MGYNYNYYYSLLTKGKKPYNQGVINYASLSPKPYSESQKIGTWI